jgi:alkylation response protein AidB-like acyl-CoA dehydrogenase
LVTTTEPRTNRTSFAESAMRLSGKGEEEALRTGAVDAADDQVESLFAPQYQTVNSPIHRAVWDKTVPLDLFVAPAETTSAEGEKAVEKCIEIVRRTRLDNSIYDERGKISDKVFGELGKAGFWGMLVDAKHGGLGLPFRRFSRMLTQIATIEPTVGGTASVHGCIGAVDPLRTFGSAEQKAKYLPLLASGEHLSAFALTEPGAGSDLTALRTTAELHGDHYEVNGEKLFITNAIGGRIIGLVCMVDGKPSVLIAELPAQENEAWQIVRYDLMALRHTYNNGLKFNRFRVPRENLLVPPLGDGLTIAYHGLNLGRTALCANAAGVMRQMLANLLPWADFRKTYGAKINTRELVKRRIARLAALITGADALTDWCSWLIDQGYRGELECVVAKIFGSESLKEGAIELFMKTHGGRSFLKGHVFADNVYDCLAPCIYEGEGEMLGMAFFKSLAKQHGMNFFEPVGKALNRNNMKTFSPANPFHVWKLRNEMMSYGKWFLGQKFAGSKQQALPGMHRSLAKHVRFALAMFATHPQELSGIMVKHQLKLPDRQCRIAEVSQRIQDTIVLLVTALYANRKGDDITIAAADILCEDLARKLTGQRPSDSYFRSVGRLADMIIEGKYREIEGLVTLPVMRPYDTK